MSDPSIEIDLPRSGDESIVVGLTVNGIQKLGGAYVGSGDTLREAITDLLDKMDETYPGWFAGGNSRTDIDALRRDSTQ